VNIFVVC